MKILITYYSGTGNTEKIAISIKDGIIDHEVELLPVKKVDPNSLSSYDLVFLGSGIYAFNVSRKITSLIKKAPQLPSKLAYFYTHESKTPWPKAFKSVNKIIEQHNCEVLGEFDCCGENLVSLAKEQREAYLSRLSPEERREAEETYLKHIKGHPNEDDFEKARIFAQSIIKKL
ncbi:MAG: flavodoxin family protein [Promethearchaeota archaeon]